jgi:hypothetical protein
MDLTTETATPSTTVTGFWGEFDVSRPFLLELFVLSNLAFLILDVYVAHAFNDFAHWAEWIPVYFAGVGSLALLVSVVQEYRRRTEQSRWIGHAVGWASILVGLAGLVWHLEGWFFESVTLLSLTYSAPFVAPLSFAGLGCLLLLNRLEDPAQPAWGRWVVFLALGGFVGNFALSLIDHAQNAFFYWTEWIPVIGSALGVGILAAIVVRPPTRPVLRLAFWIMGLQVVVGLLGAGLHVEPLVTGAAAETGFWDALRYGPPVFAPLLFVDLAALAALGLWDLYAKLPEGSAASPGR